jgi:hypothetical protein
VVTRKLALTVSLIFLAAGPNLCGQGATGASSVAESSGANRYNRLFGFH